MRHLLGQRFTHLTVREAGDELRTMVNYLDGEAEVEASLHVGSADFLVRQASLRVHRGPGTGQDWPLDRLAGQNAYLGAGPSFRQALSGEPSGVGQELFLEALKGILQAEEFVVRQRGYQSPEEYEQYFARAFAGSCVYYSHFFAQPLRSFHDYIGDQERQGLPFNRYRQAAIYRREEGGYALYLQLMDSFHHILLELAAGTDRLITAARGEVRRSPDSICRRGEERAEALRGGVLGAQQHRELAERANGGAGCSHLADLAQEGGRYLDRLLKAL